MAITILQMAEKILEEEKRPLSAWEIWQVAENKGYDKLVDSTLSTRLSELIDADVRDNRSSIFIALSDRPKRFMLKSQMYNMHIRPGDRVRILEHLLINIDLGIGAMELAATKGSIGTIVSYAEYRDHINEHWFQSVDQHQDHLWWVRTEMSAGAYYPIKFEEVVQPSEDEYAYWNSYIEHLSVTCQVGAIKVLPSRSFIVI